MESTTETTEINYENPESLLIGIESKDDKTLYNNRELLIYHSITIKNLFDCEDSSKIIKLPIDSYSIILFFKWITLNKLPTTTDDKILLLTIADFLNLRNENRLCTAIINSFEKLGVKAKHITHYLKTNDMAINMLNLSQILYKDLIVITEIAEKETYEEAIVRDTIKKSIYKNLQHTLSYYNIIPSDSILSEDAIIHSAQVLIDTCPDTDKVNLVKDTLGKLKLIDDIAIEQLNLIARQLTENNTKSMFDLIDKNMAYI